MSQFVGTKNRRKDLVENKWLPAGQLTEWISHEPKNEKNILR